MTNDELNKLIDRFQDKEDAVSASELHAIACGLISFVEQLCKVIRMQKETIDFYALTSSYYINGANYIQNHIDDSDLEDFDQLKYNTGVSIWEKLSIGGKKARATQTAVEEKLKEMGIEK